MMLLVAATPWESKPLARTLGLRRREGGLLRGVHAGRDLALLECGVGPERAARSLRSLSGTRPESVLCVGFAGALSDALSPGDLFVDEDSPSSWRSAAHRAARGLASFHEGALACSERVLSDPAQKRAVFQSTGALAVDMESRAVRDWARGQGIPFMAARVVLDAAGERLPDSAPKDDGFWTLLGYGASRLRELPCMLRLAGRQSRGMKILGAFLSRWISEVQAS